MNRPWPRRVVLVAATLLVLPATFAAGAGAAAPAPVTSRIEGTIKLADGTPAPCGSDAWSSPCSVTVVDAVSGARLAVAGATWAGSSFSIEVASSAIRSVKVQAVVSGHARGWYGGATRLDAVAVPTSLGGRATGVDVQLPPSATLSAERDETFDVYDAAGDRIESVLPAGIPLRLHTSGPGSDRDGPLGNRIEVWWPGVVDVAEATSVTLAPGEHRELGPVDYPAVIDSQFGPAPVTVSRERVAVGEPFAVSVHVEGTPAPGGEVQIDGRWTPVRAGHASATVAAGVPGVQDRLVGHYSGDLHHSWHGINYNPAVRVYDPVGAPTTTRVEGPTTPFVYRGISERFAVTVTRTSPGTPSGEVALVGDGRLWDSARLDHEGRAQLSGGMSPGQHSYHVEFLGGGGSAASASATTSVTVTKTPPTMNLAAPGELVSGVPFSVTSKGNVPTIVASEDGDELGRLEGGGPMNTSEATLVLDRPGRHTLTFDAPESEWTLPGREQIVVDVRPQRGTFHGMSPVRILDTRNGTGRPIFCGGPLWPCVFNRVGAGISYMHTVAGPHNWSPTAPADARAVVLSVTATDVAAPGYVTVFPTGRDRPTASNVNYEPGRTSTNLVTVGVGKGGQVDLFTSASAHLVVDLVGWFSEDPAGERFNAVTPDRALDTRETDTRLAAAGSVDVTVTGRGGVPAGATSVALNVTAVDAACGGYVTAFPTGSPQPLVSNVTELAGGTQATAVLVKVGNGGQVSLFSSCATDLVVDVTGWYGATGAVFTPTVPERVVDTRTGLGTPRTGTLPGGSSSTIDTTAVDTLPASATAAVYNATALGEQPGYVTLFPAGATRPLASTLNPVPGGTVTNQATIGTTGGRSTAYTYGATHLVVDVTGAYWPG